MKQVGKEQSSFKGPTELFLSRKPIPLLMYDTSRVQKRSNNRLVLAFQVVSLHRKKMFPAAISGGCLCLLCYPCSYLTLRAFASQPAASSTIALQQSLLLLMGLNQQKKLLCKVLIPLLLGEPGIQCKMNKALYGTERGPLTTQAVSSVIGSRMGTGSVQSKGKLILNLNLN